MKNSLPITRLLLVTLSFSFLLIQCKDDSVSSDDNSPIEIPDEEIETPADDIPVDSGAVGLVIDTRSIAKKGYEPATAEIDFTGAFSSFSQEIPVNPRTNVATLQIDTEDLTDDEITQLDNGVDVTIRIFNESSDELASYSDNVRVNASNTPLSIQTGLPVIYPELAIREDTPYLLQAMTEIPGFEDDVDVVSIHIDNNFEPGIDAMVLKPYLASPADEYALYFEHISNSTYYIKIRPMFEDLDDTYYLRMSDPGNFYNFYATEPEDADYYKFTLTRDENGFIKIKPLSGAPLRARETNAPFPQLGYADIDSSPDDYTPFRMVAANIIWEVEDRGTDYNPPIMPPAKLEFAYEAVLQNCSSATLTETVGRSETQTRSYTVGTEESLELFSSEETSVDVTTSAEASAEFFGIGSSVSVETSVGFSYTTSETEATTNTWEETVEEAVEISRVREVEIPPFTAVEVYDAIQSIDNVRIPFVQTLRVRGMYDGSDPLSGDEIASQLLDNQFGGVVSNVQDAYVEITVRGTATIHKMLEVQSQVNELEGVCE